MKSWLVWRALWFRVVLCLMCVGFAMVPGAKGAEATVKGPRIVAIERRAGDLVIRAAAPEGVARVVLESCRREDLRAWIPVAVARVAAGVGEVTFQVKSTAEVEMFRVRADRTDPLPAAFYLGSTNFPGQPAGGGPGGPLRAGDAAPPEAQAGDSQRDVVESDIWIVRGDTLYFFNQLRGLQIIDITVPDAPAVTGTFPLPGMGEQMYLLEDRYAVLLAHDPCQQWGLDAESAVILVDTTTQPPAELARVPVAGRIVESRLVGTSLYVATETWKLATDGSGAWQSGTWVASFDLAQPTSPKAREPLWFPGSGNVVTATDRFLFVAVTDYSRAWPWKSNLRVIDVSAPDGSLNAFADIPLRGRVADKFKIDLAGDVLRVVVEATESSNSGRWVTVLETYRLADPRAVPPVSYTELDRLELGHGERLFATRFDGTRGYFVTFERIDPLWVIDLSDPTDLKIVGELEIPGWSTYIRPMGDRLLTLGVDDARGSRVAVQLFDVADPAHPALLAKVPLGDNASWSEATQDEKAFGVFPDDGLLLVPLSDWRGNGGRTGVQLIDFTPDSLTRRGFLAQPDLVPRRATYHKDRVLAVSGRLLTTADVSDRDHPRSSAMVELAYPVERVLVAGNYLLEFAGNSARVRTLGDETPGTVAIGLGETPVLGAALQGSRLHVIQGTPATVTWEQDTAAGDWIAHTNVGQIVASVWDASALPALSRLGESKTETDQTWLADRQAFWLPDDVLVWAGSGSSSYPWWWWGGPMIDVVAPGRMAGGIADRWMPWGYGAPRDFIAVSTTDPAAPRIVSQTRIGSGGDAAGKVFAEGSLMFSARQRFESQVTGTNTVVEGGWFPKDPGSAGETKDPDANETVEWRMVTNSYPILTWWSKYELDVIDFAGDPSKPTVRPPLALPGALEGLSHQGSVLYTTASRDPDGEGKAPLQSWLEASAYDGVAVHLVDSLAIADSSAGEAFAVTVSGGLAYVARGGWDPKADLRLEVWSVGDDGRWAMGTRRKLNSPPGELRVFGDLLLSRNGGVLDLFGISQPASPEPLPTQPSPGCYGGNLERADGDSTRGLWLPLGDFGAVRIGP